MPHTKILLGCTLVMDWWSKVSDELPQKKNEENCQARMNNEIGSEKEKTFHIWNGEVAGTVKKKCLLSFVI